MTTRRLHRTTRSLSCPHSPVGYAVGPIAVGAAAGAIGWGNAVLLTGISVVVALGLVMVWLPETKGKELEETARV